MRYRGSLTIAAGTTEADPARETIELCAGRISGVELLFPPGHSGLTYVQVWRHERQIFPTTPGEAFRGDGLSIVFGENWPIAEVPHSVELRGWAPSATLDHTVFVDISIREIEQVTEGLWGQVALPEGI
jgi:hypothetical protein